MLVGDQLSENKICLCVRSRWLTSFHHRYRKRELGLQIALLMSELVTSQAFAGLVSAGILKGMDGTTNLEVWRWLFILEGLFTVVVGVVALFVLPYYPHTTRWLSNDEKVCAVYHLEEGAGRAAQEEEAGQASIKQGFGLAVRDYRVWLYACMQMMESQLNQTRSTDLDNLLDLASQKLEIVGRQFPRMLDYR